MSLDALTAAERERLVELKLRHAYEEPAEGDQVITVSDLVDGQIVERPASFDESWLPVARELRLLPDPESQSEAAGEQDSAQADDIAA